MPLVRAGSRARSLATLRAALPLEVARRPTAPTLVVPLEGSSGKTFRDGDLAITVREYRVDPQGPATVKLTVRIEGKRGEADPRPAGAGRRPALVGLSTSRSELADAQGTPVSGLGGGSSRSGDEVRELSIDYNVPTHPGPRSPSPRPTCGSTGPRGSPGSCRSSSGTSRSPDRSDLARSRPCRRALCPGPRR